MCVDWHSPRKLALNCFSIGFRKIKTKAITAPITKAVRKHFQPTRSQSVYFEEETNQQCEQTSFLAWVRFVLLLLRIGRECCKTCFNQSKSTRLLSTITYDSQSINARSDTDQFIFISGIYKQAKVHFSRVADRNL